MIQPYKYYDDVAMSARALSWSRSQDSTVVRDVSSYNSKERLSHVLRVGLGNPKKDEQTQTIDTTWDELPDDIRQRIMNMRISKPMSVVTIRKQPWLITAQLVEEGVAPPSQGRWELTYDGYQRLGDEQTKFLPSDSWAEFGLSSLNLRVPGASHAGKRIPLVLRESEYSVLRPSLARYMPELEEWNLHVPLAGVPRDTNLMAKLIGTIAAEAFDRLLQAVRQIYIKYPHTSYQANSGKSPSLLRQSILRNLDEFARMVRAHHDGSFVEQPKEADPFDDMMNKWQRDLELRDSDKDATSGEAPRPTPRAKSQGTSRRNFMN